MINMEGLHGHPRYFEFLDVIGKMCVGPGGDTYGDLVIRFAQACALYKARLPGLDIAWLYVAVSALEYLMSMLEGPDVFVILQDMAQLHNDKNAGYAGHSNTNPLANFYACRLYLDVTPLEGCLVRICDKYERIRHLRKDPGNDKVDESIIETVRDLIAYALIAAILYIDNEYD